MQRLSGERPHRIERRRPETRRPTDIRSLVCGVHLTRPGPEENGVARWNRNRPPLVRMGLDGPGPHHGSTQRELLAVPLRAGQRERVCTPAIPARFPASQRIALAGVAAPDLMISLRVPSRDLVTARLGSGGLFVVDQHFSCMRRIAVDVDLRRIPEQPLAVCDPNSAFECDLDVRQRPQHVEDVVVIAGRHGTLWPKRPEHYPTGWCTIVFPELGPSGTPGFAELFLDRRELRSDAEHDVLSTHHEPRAGDESPVLGAGCKHEHLASRQHPFLTRLTIRPPESVSKQIGEATGNLSLIPVFLQLEQIDFSRTAGDRESFGEPRRPLGQQRDGAIPTALKEDAYLDRSRLDDGRPFALVVCVVSGR